MKRLIFTLLAASLVTGASYAATVHYDTTAGSAFTCINSGSVTGCGTNQVIYGDMILYYLPSNATLIATPSTFGNFGSILVGCLGGGTVCGPQSITGVSLTITINQISPDTLSQSIPAGSLNGNISGSSVSTTLQWTPGANVELDGPITFVNYSILNPNLGLVPPSNDNCGANCPIPSPAGKTSIQGLITAATVPEPGVSLLVAGGLLALGSIRRRRK